MRINSISFKLISIALFITTAVLCGLGFYGYEETKEKLNEQLALDIKHLTKRLHLNLPGPIWNFESSTIASTLESEAAAHFIKGIYVINENGDLIDAIEKQNGELKTVDSVPEGLKNTETSDIVYVDEGSEEQHLVGKFLLDISDEKIRVLLDAEVKRIIIQIAALNGILFALFAIAIGRMTRPLSELQAVAASIAEGNYDLDLDINRKDEIGELADSFNTMKTGIKKKVQDLRDLNVTGDQLAVCSDQVVALEKALKALSVHSGVKFGSVYLYNDEDKLELQSFYPPKIVDSDQKPKKFESGEGIIGLSVKNGEIIYIPDTSSDERFVDGEGQAKSLICVPLKDGELSLGVLNLSGNVSEVSFEESDREFAETLARQLVTTIKNIRMRETIEEQNRTLELKVKERTAELAQKNYDMQGMLHNMKQGLFTVVDGGQVHPEYSSFLESVFETKHIAGRNVIDLLFTNAKLGSNEVNQNLVAIESLIGEDHMMFDFNAHLLAKEFECEINDKRKILSLDWNAIVAEDEINKLMVTVRDVTLLKELEHEAANQKRELFVISQLIKVPEHKYIDFNKAAREFIAENRALIESTSDKNDDVLANLFRNMHTIKGNARTYGFIHLTDIVHDVETTYSELRKSADKPWDQALLLEELQRVEDGLNEYAHVHHEVLGRGETASSGDGPISEDIILKIQSCIDKVQEEFPVVKEKQSLQPIQVVLDEFNSCSLEEAVADIVRSLPSIATELGKNNPTVKVDAEGVRINNQSRELMSNVFSHLLRNSLDHGIETPEERAAAGKPETGLIELRTTNGDNHLQIHIKDDGKGINLERLFNKGIEIGKWQAGDQPSKEDIAALIFHSGVSTKEQVTSISGRGVGMDAVRQFLRDNGGDISLHLLDEKSAGNPCVPFEIVVSLPRQTFKVAA